jgi:hypothetical protein
MDPVQGGTSNTFAHTVAGSDRVLYVFVTTRFSDTVTAVTYNGDALSQIATVNNSPDNLVSACVWRLIAPDTGTNNVVVTFSAARTGECTAVSLTGVHQTTPEGTPATGSDVSGGGFTNPSVVVSSATGELVVDCVGLQNDSTSKTLTVGADQTQLEQGSVGTTTSIVGAVSTEPGAASVTMSWTPSTADDWAQVAVPVKPSAAAPPASTLHNLAMMGAG